MVVNRERLNELSQPVVNIYNQIEEELLVNVARKLKSKESELTRDEVVAWKLRKLEQMGALEKENIEYIRKLSGSTNKQLNKVLLNAGLEGVEANEEIMKKALKEGADLIEPDYTPQNSPRIISILEAYEEQAKNILNLTNTTMLTGSQQVYRDILNKVEAEVLSGTRTGYDAVRVAVVQFNNNGIPALVDRAGRRWSPEAYVSNVVFTTSNNVINSMQDERMEEWGVDLCEVSSHMGARPKCEPYQGKIYSIRGNHPRFPSLSDTSIGQPDGLFGIRCGHVKYPYIEGYSVKRFHPPNKTENRKSYENRQKQRYLERNIRKAKREKRMLEEIGDEQGAKQAGSKIYKRQKAMREFIKATGRTRRRVREQIF